MEIDPSSKLPIRHFNEKPLDKLGHGLKVGQIICYGHALVGSAALRIGKVLAIKHRDTEQHGMCVGDPSSDIIWKRKDHVADIDVKPDFLAVQYNWSLTVIGVDNDSNRAVCNADKVPELCTTKITLMHPERTLILDRAVVPSEIRNLLDPITIDTNLKYFLKPQGGA